MPGRDRLQSRRSAFVGLVAACVVVGAGFVIVAAVSRSTAAAGASSRAAEGSRILAEAIREGTQYLLYRDLSSPGELRAELALAPLKEGTIGLPTRVGLGCERVYYAAGSGLCLAFEVDPLPGYRAQVFGSDFKVRGTHGLEGFPSRARVSPSGRYGAFTIFVSGHSYRDLQFSTRTGILDMRTGKYLVKNLESFKVLRDGREIRSRDFNFWGVTFARDSGEFYATLWTQGKAYLVEGDLRTRMMRVLRENAECPSLSPDETRVAYKKRADGTGPWRFYVLDLASGRETPLADTHSRDDQVEWLDDNRIAYSGNGKIWVVPADGSGSPKVLVDRAYSPTALRTSAG